MRGWSKRNGEHGTKGTTRTQVVVRPAFGPHFLSGQSLGHIHSMLGLGHFRSKRQAVGTSLVVQWLRIHGTVQGTQV